MKYLKTYYQLLESNKTEMESSNILKNNKVNPENIEEIVDKLCNADSSKNQINIPYMAVCYIQGTKDYNTLKSVFDDYNDLLKRQLIKPIVIDKTNGYKLKIGDKLFDGFISFSEFIHGKKPSVKPAKIAIKTTDEIFNCEETPIWEGNGIFVYDVPDFETSIRYTQGALTGKRYLFCIGQYTQKMYQSYRDSKTSTFYFIVDKNRDMDDPLHIVVYDNNDNGIELTDADNKTGDIAEFGNKVQKYQQYLKSKGVPYDKIMVNRPKTEQEIEEDKLLGEKNDDLNWFVALPVEMKSKYVGRGYLLTDEQFDYLLE